LPSISAGFSFDRGGFTMRKNMLAKLAVIALAAALQLACAGAAQVLDSTATSSTQEPSSTETAPNAVDFGPGH
jgi:hypothetical protein